MSSTVAHKSRIIIRNLPSGTEFGIDYSSWYVGPRFCGLCMIPSGVHFVFTSSVSKEEQHAPRNGQFLVLSEEDGEPDEFYQAVWDEANEELMTFKRSKSNISENEAKYLSPYPCDEKYETWKKLTSFITKETVKRVTPLCQRISPSTQVDCTAELEKKERKRLGIQDNNDDILNYVKIRFANIPEQKFPDGAKPHEITKCSMDYSFALESMLQKLDGSDAEKELLAEIQFAFVCFMLGQVFDAFEHWKTLIRLICKCDDALNRRPTFFINFLEMIEIQIREIPEDFFVDIVAEQNFLVQTFQILFSTVRDSEALNRRLVQKVKGLKELLTMTFNWDFDFEDDEDLPVVVETG